MYFIINEFNFIFFLMENSLIFSKFLILFFGFHFIYLMIRSIDFALSNIMSHQIFCDFVH